MSWGSAKATNQCGTYMCSVYAVSLPEIMIRQFLQCLNHWQFLLVHARGVNISFQQHFFLAFLSNGLEVCIILVPSVSLTARVVLRWSCANVIANIDDLAISIWAPKVINALSRVDDI